MTIRELGGLNDGVSLLGFGCMRLPLTNEDTQEINAQAAQKMVDHAIENGINYFDTAYGYHNGNSQVFMGQALAKHPRGSFFLANKLPVWLVKSGEDVHRIFEEQLLKCKVDYFDYYLMHSMTDAYMGRCEQHGVYELLLEKKKQGKIRHLGFSFHDKPQVLAKLLEAHTWDFAQIQLNYMDWELQDAKAQYELLEKAGVPVVVMEPVRGGALATLSASAIQILKRYNPVASPASWALRYAASLPGVLTVLSGMSDMAQLTDNIAAFESFCPLNEKENQVLAKAAEAYRASGAIPCTGCRYCMDCPAGVDIPKVFEIYNHYRVTGNKIGFEISNGIIGPEKQAKNCVDCKQCIERCPQKIEIPLRMKEVANVC